MSRRVLAAALAAASLALLGALAVTAAAATTALPPCAPGTPAPAPPVVTHASLFNDAFPPRIVAGRPFSIEYDDPALVTAVQQTIGPPGTVIRDDIGGLVELTLPSPGVVTMTVVYYVVRNGTCTFSSTYALNVDAGDPVPAGIGVTREFSPRGGFAPKKLPRFGDYDAGRPAVALTPYDCDGARTPEPLSLVLRTEANVRKRPSLASPSVRLDVPDPCESPTRSVAAPGARLWFVKASPYANEGERFLAVQVTTKAARRWQVEFAQGARRLGFLRFYTAFKPQNGRFDRGWVMATDADAVRAACRRPSFTTGLGFRGGWPLPPCRR